MSKTILLIQTGRPHTRTYEEFETTDACLDGICKFYEKQLVQWYSDTTSITYDISELFQFIDELADLSCLVFQSSTKTYAPFSKEWIKEQIYTLLCRFAT